MPVNQCIGTRYIFYENAYAKPRAQQPSQTAHAPHINQSNWNDIYLFWFKTHSILRKIRSLPLWVCDVSQQRLAYHISFIDLFTQNFSRMFSFVTEKKIVIINNEETSTWRSLNWTCSRQRLGREFTRKKNPTAAYSEYHWFWLFFSILSLFLFEFCGRSQLSFTHLLLPPWHLCTRHG